MRSWIPPVVLFLFAAGITGCGATRAADPNAVGRDGWIKADLKPGEIIHVQSGLQAIWVSKSDEGEKEYLVQVKPMGGTAPIYPGSEFLRGSSYLYKEKRYYTLPEGKTFQNVYDWYMDWFAFGKSGQ